ncbi:hypothetical protein Xbed_03365 [Xenorhabdus beddingii]|uniref:Uncharacterized protein n=1 Tax=Xenorhabdus beddingii TaxID=40578 RepID=A0A1Y2SET8_9GAMM|nr:hypothetical protein [Xenorhabdus beddingii]OTA17211.1 hypothetical protein Xbed_03365 [Xenorhabdus beddingii]
MKEDCLQKYFAKNSVVDGIVEVIGYDWPDDIEHRITVIIDEVHHSQVGLDTLCEINLSFYEYSLLAPEYFFYEGANENAHQACSSVSAGVCE